MIMTTIISNSGIATASTREKKTLQLMTIRIGTQNNENVSTSPMGLSEKRLSHAIHGVFMIFPVKICCNCLFSGNISFSERTQAWIKPLHAGPAKRSMMVLEAVGYTRLEPRNHVYSDQSLIPCNISQIRCNC